MQVFNATLEDYKWQCDGRVYMFAKQAVTEIPDMISMFLEDQTAHRGLVPLRYGDDFKEAIRRARVNYLNNCLEPRISMVNAHKYDLKLKGVELNDKPEWKRWMRWRDELYRLLELERPLEEELSFLSKEQMQKLGITDAKLQEFKNNMPENVFAGIEAAKKIEISQLKTDSFDDLKEIVEDEARVDDEAVILAANRKVATQQIGV